MIDCRAGDCSVITFAIVIPNLNQSHFLSTALESLNCQSTTFNLAIMDGGSTDDFEGVVDKYSDMITFLRSAPDKGQTAAIKEGKEAVSGDIVAWLNADDYYFPATLDKVATCFQTHPDIDVVYGDAIHVSPEGMFLSYFPVIQEFDAGDLTRTCFICQPACFVRRAAYEKAGGLDPKLHYTMDWDLWCRLSNAGAKFYYLQEVLAAVRYYPGTKTLSGDLRRYKEIWRIERKYGHRLFPRSWAGAYLFDLDFNENKNRFEKTAFSVLKNVRRIKRKFLSKNDHLSNETKTIYGFYPLDTLVDECGIIHLPWYGSKRWSALRLKVDPATDSYQVEINGRDCQKIKFENGHLFVQLPLLDTAHREISIRFENSQQWRLLEFGCKFEIDTDMRTRK
jgi:glycosyltransferase involved in cell wall biosynthesis